MSLVEVIYASAPVGETIIASIEVQTPGKPTLYACNGFEDHWLGVDGDYYKFEGGNLEVSLPSKTSGGSQSLDFGVANVNGLCHEYVRHAIENRAKVKVIFRKYLASDKSAPMERPYIMNLLGASFVNGVARFECGYYNIMDTAWPRQRFTTENAPALKYMR